MSSERTDTPSPWPGYKRPEPEADFLRFIADRLVYVYGESENVDYVRHLRELAHVVARLDSPDLVVCTVPELRAAVEAHEEWFSERLGNHIERDCGTDVAARLRERRGVSR